MLIIKKKNWANCMETNGSQFYLNTIVVTKLCLDFPKHIYVLNLCIYIHDPKWEKSTKLQEIINSLTSISTSLKIKYWSNWPAMQ